MCSKCLPKDLATKVRVPRRRRATRNGESSCLCAVANGA
jgi:hypothetical protein